MAKKKPDQINTPAPNEEEVTPEMLNELSNNRGEDEDNE